MDIKVILPFYMANTEMEIVLSGKYDTGEAERLYRVIYDKAAEKGREDPLGGRLVSRKVSSLRDGYSLLVEGSFVIDRVMASAQKDPPPGFRELVVSVKYHPDIETWPDFTAVGQA